MVLEAMKRCPNVDRPVRRRRPVHKEDKLFGLHMVSCSWLEARRVTSSNAEVWETLHGLKA